MEVGSFVFNRRGFYGEYLGWCWSKIRFGREGRGVGVVFERVFCFWRSYRGW